MRRHAKAPSAGSTSGIGSSRVRFGRASATRGASRDAKGSGAPSRRTRIALLALVAVFALALTIAPAAFSAARTQTSTFDGSDTTAGAFSEVGRLAIHQSTGTVYAIDNTGSGGVVDKLDSSGAAQDFSALGSSSLSGADVTAPDGPVSFDLGADSDLAVDNSGTASDGRLYVLEEYGSSPHTAFAFDSAGNYLHKIDVGAASDACGIAVDGAGHVWIADYESESVIEYDAAGAPTGNSIDTSGQGHPCHLAFDSADNLYVALFNGALQKYDSTGAFQAEIDAGATSAVAIDPYRTPFSTEHVFAVHSGHVSEYDAAGNPVSEFGLADLSSALGVAVNPANGDAYVAGQADNLVHVFELPSARTQTSTFDGSDTTAGAFSEVGRLAIHQSTGTVYAIDNTGSGGVVDKLDSSGAAQDFSALGSSSLSGADVTAPDGPVSFDLGADSDLAVDNSGTASDGRLYVLEEYGSSPHTAFAFDSAGNYLHKIDVGAASDACGIAVDGAGHVWIADYESESVIEYDAAGAPTGNSIDTSGQGHPCHLAFDSADNLYVALFNGALQKYDSTGAFQAEIDAGATSAVAIDPYRTPFSTEHVFAVHSGHVSEYDAAGNPVSEFGLADLSSALGVAVNPANGDAYVAGQADNLVHVFELSSGATEFPLHINKNGSGSGSVECEVEGGPAEACEPKYFEGAEVALVPNENPGSEFTGWSGDCSGSGACALTIDEVHSVIATFNQLPPIVENNPSGTVTATTAVLNGHVNNNGSAGSTCKFAVALKEPPHTVVAEPPCVPNPITGSTNTAVEATATGLNAATEYVYRVAATNAGGTSEAEPAEPFTTLVGPPRVLSASASVLGTSTTVLSGYVNPSGLLTSYHFEYDTTAYKPGEAPHGTEVPRGGADIGNGNDNVAVSGEIEELSADTTYHYRLVATNASGTTEGSDQTFTTTPIPASCPNAARRSEQTSTTTPSGTGYLPGCMALEMVSPPKKFNQPARQPNFSASGDEIEFTSIAALAGTPQVGFAGDPYVAVRESDGWTTHAVQPPPDLLKVNFSVCSYNMDLSKWTVHPFVRPPGSAPGATIPYSGNLSGEFSPLGPVLTPLNPNASEDRSCEGGSADASHLFFGAKNTAFLSGDPAQQQIVNPYEAYVDGEGNPTVELISRDKNGKVWGGACGAEIGWRDAVPRANRGAISPDGSRVFFSARPAQGTGECPAPFSPQYPPQRVLERLQTPAGPVIGEVSASECTRVAPPCDQTRGNDNFRAASQEGGLVYFTSTRQLTNSDLDTGTKCDAGGGQTTGCDLYLYDASRPAGSRLTQVSAGDATDPTPGQGAKVRGVLDIAGDGSHAYFVAEGVLTTKPNSQGISARSGKPNLYLFQRDSAYPGGRTVFIATLASSDAETWGNFNAGYGPGLNPAAAVPLLGGDPTDPSLGGNGHVLVFRANAALTPDDTDGGKADVYRYDSDTGALQRISRAAPGGSDNGAFDVVVTQVSGEEVYPQSLYFGRWVSEDGRTVVFRTKEALDPADGDNLQTSYLWRDGNVVALRGSSAATTTGLGQQNFLAPTVSTSGDVAFLSSDQLLPEDGDTAFDVFVARAGGGFPIRRAPTLCQGEACQPHGEQPSSAGTGSESFSGPGNQAAKPTKCKKGKVRRHGKCVKKHHHSHRRHHHSRQANTDRRAGK